MAAMVKGRGIAFIMSIPKLFLSRSLVPAGASQQLSRLHTGTSLNRSNWERKNLKVYPPQLPDEPRRPAEVHHSRRQIKYSHHKMWYLAKLIRGMSIEEAIAQLEFNDKKGARIVKEVLLEAQEMAVKEHNVEFKSNLYLEQSFSAKGQYQKRIRYHGKGYCAIMNLSYCHYFVKLVEGLPPKVEESTSIDKAKEFVQKLKNRTIVHSL
ncbi:large ribosomal subunit protein uL22m [Austrofundulus limnaeus]|uniref:Large ribosomal subunit protein uL22m n=1 Tax=Austrofundulus limnaeus TaxID=52670 RepID=A0A2I4AVM0_AUSLI|nr:PREDICTED: 39S ribosomal protein L22, mitochondrial [Austrofundulus limnaeus]